MAIVTYNGGLNFTHSGLTTSLSLGNTEVTPAEAETISGIQAVGVSDEPMVLGDLAAPGWIFLKNLDATNFVTLGSDGTLYPIKILPGGSAGPFLWKEAAVHLKADTAPCLVQYVITGR